VKKTQQIRFLNLYPIILLRKWVLALLDVADVIRPYPEVIDYLQHVKDDNFLDELVKFDGGQETRDAIYAYLDKYGMRCVGEIDITRTRWSEKPIHLSHDSQ
jgi:phosphoenolpyruvate synthase/pyruvate phosphate dikinase